MIDIEETEQGMRIDTFLANADLVSEEDMEPHMLAEEVWKLQTRLSAILTKRNRLPD